MASSHKPPKALNTKSGQGSSKTPAANFQPPSGSSFFFRIDTLAPNFEVLEAQTDDFDNWIPPFHWDAYRHVNGLLYRWRDGRVTPAALGVTRGNQYSSATVFTQYPDTGHFLAVEYDARTRNVVQHGNWQKLGFHHIDRQPNGGKYSELDFGPRCSERRLAAPPTSGSVWASELLTADYEHHTPPGTHSPRQSAGLTGKLSLILALVAHCCPPAELALVLANCIRPGSWISRGVVQPGRTQYRGVVVTIWLDPTSSTTAGVLGSIERGTYGPFFR